MNNNDDIDLYSLSQISFGDYSFHYIGHLTIESILITQSIYYSKDIPNIAEQGMECPVNLFCNVYHLLVHSKK